MLFGKALGCFRLPIELQGEKREEKSWQRSIWVHDSGLVSEFDNETQLNMLFYLI